MLTILSIRNDPKNGEEEKDNIIELIGKRWTLLGKLSEKRWGSLREFATALKKSPSQVFRDFKQLEEEGLAKRIQGEQGRRFYYCISENGKRIFTACESALRQKPERKFEDYKIQTLLHVLENESLSLPIRLAASESFRNACSNYPEEVLNIDKAREVLQRVASDRSRERVSESLRRSVSAILRRSSTLISYRNWILKEIYPTLLENLNAEDPDIRIWTAKMIHKIAVAGIDISARTLAKNTALDIWFSGNLDDNEGLRLNIQGQLRELFSEQLFKEIMEETKNPDRKRKAEQLLETLMDCLNPD